MADTDLQLHQANLGVKEVSGLTAEVGRMERSRTPGVPQAMARFAVVSLTEILALAACYVPLFEAREPWQRDCIRLGLFASFGAVLTIAIVACVFGLIPRPKDKPADVLARQLSLLLEGGILGMYLLNMAILVCVIIRTGGPSSSLYAPLVPIQLSGMLFLQIQKELLVNEPPIVPVVCTLIACLAMGMTYLSPGFIWSWLRFTKDGIFDFKGWNTALTIAGMLLAFLAYWMPKQKKLTDEFERIYPRE